MCIYTPHNGEDLLCGGFGIIQAQKNVAGYFIRRRRKNNLKHCLSNTPLARFAAGGKFFWVLKEPKEFRFRPRYMPFRGSGGFETHSVTWFSGTYSRIYRFFFILPLRATDTGPLLIITSLIHTIFYFGGRHIYSVALPDTKRVARELITYRG